MTQQATLPEPRLKTYVGSTLLFIGIFSTATLAGILILLATVFPFNVRYQISKAWCALVVSMAKWFCGVGYEIEGLENLDIGQTAIVLCNHQSAWETLALRWILPPTQTALLKRSLTWFPLWGWALSTLKPIAIDRKSQRAALKILLKKGKACLHEGLWVVVFPEGTRSAAGEVQKFSVGGALLAEKTGYPVIPVAHNAGNVWPRYSFLKYPGTIRVKIGPVIPTQGRKAQDINNDAAAWIAQAVQDLNKADGKPA
ncbi:lysophospholipid acyltransferase family protein [Methylovulum miyakonense]|uniref:lysophospholipid acyltransferase family protein n=1 Tax=Methylovulum miyakonense TaxID=645578 RepID=UPI00036EFB7A|nr:lysophospholipid acyltransferase family protein [Methylovulum miyakonense]